jgi:hypothetical protein
LYDQTISGFCTMLINLSLVAYWRRTGKQR